MQRQSFLTLVGVVGSLIGTLALFFPELVLESKGITDNGAASIWMQETGVLILSAGVVSFLVRTHPDTPTLRAILWGNALLQLGLSIVEGGALVCGALQEPAGVLPNLVVHAGFIAGNLYFATQKPQPNSRFP